MSVIMVQDPMAPGSISTDLVLFMGGVALLVLYLVWSAATEMGTKSPWRK